MKDKDNKMFARKIESKNPGTLVGGVQYTLYSEDGVHMIKVVNVCDLLDSLYGDTWFRKNLDYKYTSNGVLNWCEKNNSHYYAADREDFFEFKAVREAVEASKDCVVVEDLS